MGDSLNDDLIEYLYAMLRNTPFEPGRPVWAMSQEWLDEVRRVTSPDGHPLWEPGPRVGSEMQLFGFPVVVCKKAGAPRIRFMK